MDSLSVDLSWFNFSIDADKTMQVSEEEEGMSKKLLVGRCDALRITIRTPPLLNSSLVECIINSLLTNTHARTHGSLQTVSCY